MLQMLRSVGFVVGLLAAASATAQLQGPPYAAMAGSDGYLGLRVAPNVGVYGKLGPAFTRTGASLPGSDAAVAYGIGVSWQFSRTAAATFGWETYDLRSFAAGGDREVRAASLGLQWRY